MIANIFTGKTPITKKSWPLSEQMSMKVAGCRVGYFMIWNQLSMALEKSVSACIASWCIQFRVGFVGMSSQCAKPLILQLAGIWTHGYFTYKQAITCDKNNEGVYTGSKSTKKQSVYRLQESSGCPDSVTPDSSDWIWSKIQVLDRNQNNIQSCCLLSIFLPRMTE